MNKRIYVCGPMAGKDNLNRAAFDAAAAMITSRGDTPVIPHTIPVYEHEGPCKPVYGKPGAEGGHDGGCFLRGDIAVMVMCEGIYRLKGWRSSYGAHTESAVAKMLLIPIEDEA